MNGKINDYSRIEIGMLAGTAIGGIIALIGYLATENVAFLLVSVIGAFAGTAAGKVMERKKSEASAVSLQDKQQSID